MAKTFGRQPSNDSDVKGLSTFGCVFTPSILTIPGVIVYLRFGWVVGNVGPSISMIATDRLGAGGRPGPSSSTWPTACLPRCSHWGPRTFPSRTC